MFPHVNFPILENSDKQNSYLPELRIKKGVNTHEFAEVKAVTYTFSIYPLT